MGASVTIALIGSSLALAEVLPFPSYALTLDTPTAVSDETTRVSDTVPLSPFLASAHAAIREPETERDVRRVPFYSQFADITSPVWQKRSCGIASAAMLIEHYKPEAVASVDALLAEGRARGGYIDNVGWKHRTLVELAQIRGLYGRAYDFAQSSMSHAYNELVAALAEGPVMASVHYEFNPMSVIPHLVVITDVHDGRIYYNDPADTYGNRSLTVDAFQRAWKKRFIEVRPYES